MLQGGQTVGEEAWCHRWLGWEGVYVSEKYRHGPGRPLDVYTIWSLRGSCRLQLGLVVGVCPRRCEDVGPLAVPVHLLVVSGEWPPRCLGPVRKYKEEAGVLGVDLEVSRSLGEELGDFTVCVDWIAVIVVASQTVSS